jgi:hypothetical protein
MENIYCKSWSLNKVNVCLALAFNTICKTQIKNHCEKWFRINLAQETLIHRLLRHYPIFFHCIYEQDVRTAEANVKIAQAHLNSAVMEVNKVDRWWNKILLASMNFNLSNMFLNLCFASLSLGAFCSSIKQTTLWVTQTTLSFVEAHHYRKPFLRIEMLPFY